MSWKLELFGNFSKGYSLLEGLFYDRLFLLCNECCDSDKQDMFFNPEFLFCFGTQKGFKSAILHLGEGYSNIDDELCPKLRAFKRKFRPVRQDIQYHIKYGELRKKDGRT